ncbi:HypC/HybG/HupF family hydrogenase formation chaperone [Myxococcota bacterium]|nr:HypC/HybG/HupF family hydrogenase formation chaperone [Myxococcota bacterium]MBU1379256.1 HypC/HybG/HupF family hydrogenase formation chaperone [Myxococcota bacterium]MBU1496110.1 HypC/HybG/HupF family hydrogenase formation chaperone [Myxococcota bacterium]
MCLAVPVKVTNIIDNERAVVDAEGVSLEVSTVLVDMVSEGQWVLVHAGFVIETLTEEAARDKFDLWDEYHRITGKTP